MAGARCSRSRGQGPPYARLVVRILFDQGTPAPLRRHLGDHTVDTVGERGWSELGNGDLIAWFLGMNPLLDDRSPLLLLSDGDLDEAQPAVMGAARAFVAAG